MTDINPILFQVANQIDKNELIYTQTAFHDWERHAYHGCGTARCFGGWVQIYHIANIWQITLQAAEQLMNDALAKNDDQQAVLELMDNPTLPEGGHWYLWQLAQEIIGLNEPEGNTLFSPLADYSIQRALISYLKEGHRINPESFTEWVRGNDLDPDDYNNPIYSVEGVSEEGGHVTLVSEDEIFINYVIQHRGKNVLAS